MEELPRIKELWFFNLIDKLTFVKENHQLHEWYSALTSNWNSKSQTLIKECYLQLELTPKKKKGGEEEEEVFFTVVHLAESEWKRLITELECLEIENISITLGIFTLYNKELRIII